MSGDWFKNLARLNLPVYKFESEEMTIIYGGYSSIKKNYFGRLMLGPDCSTTFIGRKWYKSIPGMIRKQKFDIAVCEISPMALRFFQNRNGYIIPEWTSMRINIDRPLKEIYHISVSNFSDVLRRIRKNNLTYEVLSDEESLKYFYDRMYLPYISKRHGEEAWIEEMDEILSTTQSPALIAVKENNKLVGASLFSISDGSLYLHRLGLLEGNEEYRRHGVIGAIYYFGIIEGQKAGCKYMNVGGTRPFLSDGLTRFKLNLGSEFILKASRTKEYLWMGINDHSAAAREFIKNNPFMHVNKDFMLIKSGT